MPPLWPRRAGRTTPATRFRRLRLLAGTKRQRPGQGSHGTAEPTASPSNGPLGRTPGRSSAYPLVQDQPPLLRPMVRPRRRRGPGGRGGGGGILDAEFGHDVARPLCSIEFLRQPVVFGDGLRCSNRLGGSGSGLPAANARRSRKIQGLPIVGAVGHRDAATPSLGLIMARQPRGKEIAAAPHDPAPGMVLQSREGNPR